MLQDKLDEKPINELPQAQNLFRVKTKIIKGSQLDLDDFFTFTGFYN